MSQEAFPRISARTNQTVDLEVDFLNSGVPADPYAIYSVEIYKSQVLPHNIVATIPFVGPCDESYPSPAHKRDEECGGVGRYTLPFFVPAEFSAPDVYFDVWYYYPENPCGVGTEECDCDLAAPENIHKLLKCCHRFWVYPDGWFCNDGLQTVRFGFEPLDQKFHTPEFRPLEIGLTPLPLYDYNFNLVNPMIPFLQPSITVKTMNHELMVDNEPCKMGIRQGSFRNNPWVIQYSLDTTRFFKGTYQYQIKLMLPDGSTRVSKTFIFTIS
jgi:hypothetical protein